jgi:hypothetical protein
MFLSQLKRLTLQLRFHRAARSSPRLLFSASAGDGLAGHAHSEAQKV